MKRLGATCFAGACGKRGVVGGRRRDLGGGVGHGREVGGVEGGGSVIFVAVGSWWLVEVLELKGW